MLSHHCNQKLTLKVRPQINETCTGCFYKWMKGLCPNEARHRCKAEKIIFKQVQGIYEPI
jgi:hypothetical protein